MQSPKQKIEYRKWVRVLKFAFGPLLIKEDNDSFQKASKKNKGFLKDGEGEVPNDDDYC
jgi:hypothetical protein